MYRETQGTWGKLQRGFALLSMIWGCHVIGLGMMATETALAATAPSHTAPVSSEAQFLQHFISQSLTREVVPAPAPPASTAAPAQPSHREPAATATSKQLYATTLRMLFVLGLLVGLLVVGAYLLRRYQRRNPAFTKRYQLQVLARVPLAPKVFLAAVRMPGKVLLVGVTSTSLTLLGELPTEEELTTAAVADQEAFAETLKQQLHRAASQERLENGFSASAEAMRQKLSGLKQL